jgi:hypothetical protein
MAQNNTNSNIVFWNARGITNKKEILEEFLLHQNIEICAISETKLTAKSKSF